MGYTPEQLARRRRQRAHSRNRRMLAAGTLVLVLCAGGVGTYLLNRGHRHVVVVLRAAAPHQTPSPPAGHTQPEYAAAPGAPSLKRVRSQLAAATKRKRANSATPGDSGAGGVLAADAASSFEKLASTLPGRIELAVIPLGAGPREVLGTDEPAHGWSTTKVPVLVSLLRARGAEGLTSQEQQWAQSAITESNNESVLDLFGDLERLENGLSGASQYIERVLRMSGDTETVVATAPPPAGAVTTFGQTEWRPGEAVKFFRALALGCLVSASQTSYVLNLMENIEPSESWGLGSAGFSSIAFKGGWGPESSGYLVRQSGIIDPGSSSGAVTAIVAFAPSFSAGTEMLTRTATWLNQHLVLSARASTECGIE
jgi:hypothetical protein